MERVRAMLTSARTHQYHEGDLSLHESYLAHGSEPNRTTKRRAAVTIRYVPAATRIKDQSDWRQFLVRGQAAENGNVYYGFGKPGSDVAATP